MIIDRTNKKYRFSGELRKFRIGRAKYSNEKKNVDRS